MDAMGKEPPVPAAHFWVYLINLNLIETREHFPDP